MYNYKSPIETIVSEMYTRILQEQENKVFEAIQNMGINVDRDKLMKALRYDRDQYDEGYSDYIVYCGNYNCEVRPITGYREVEKEAIEAWNRRVDNE